MREKNPARVPVIYDVSEPVVYLCFLKHTRRCQIATETMLEGLCRSNKCIAKTPYKMTLEANFIISFPPNAYVLYQCFGIPIPIPIFNRLIKRLLKNGESVKTVAIKNRLWWKWFFSRTFHVVFFRAPLYVSLHMNFVHL